MAEGVGNRKEESILIAQDYLQVIRDRWKEALLVFILIFTSCVLMTYTMAPTYKSSMSFEIIPSRDLFSVSGVDPNVSARLSGDGSYMQTQFEILVSERNLAAVAHKLGLDTEWHTTKEQAGRALMGSIIVSPRKNTNIVDLIVSDGIAARAKRICQAVLECYKELRDEEENSLIREAIAKQEEMLRAKQDDLEKKEDVIRQLIRSNKYIVSNLGTSHVGAISANAEEEEVRQLLGDKRRLENEISQMTVHISKLQNLKDDDLLSYVTRTGLLTAESYCSAKVRSLNEQFTKEIDERNQKLLSGYGENHPNIKRLDEQHKTTREQLYAELVGMRDAMADQIDVKKSELAKLAQRSDEARDRLREKTLDDRRVNTAIQEYQAEKARYDELNNRFLSECARLEVPRPCYKQHSQPYEASAPSSPNKNLNTIVGAVIGLIAAIITAFTFNYFDTSIKSLEDAEVRLGLPVLGVIPQDAGILMLQDGDSPDAEAYRILRTNIELKRSVFKATTFCVCSANAGEGKTTTLSNLAYVLAQGGYSTLMVDADMRRPRLARYAEISADVGLSNYLSSNMELRDVVVKTKVPNLYILPPGPIPTDPSGLLGSHRMTQLIEEATARFDYVLFDSPPALGVSDASLLVSKADATLLVLQPRKMPVKALLRAKTTIQNAGGQIMGLVMNNVDISSDTQYQYYTTYYSYYSGDKSRKEPKAAAKQAETAPKPEVAATENNEGDIY
ncbi:MAG: polysaccharide biosynthesis tyrosine autokinase [Akkermansia sp.]